MIRRIAGLAVLMLALGAAYGAAGAPTGKDGGEKPTMKKAPYVHSVIFYLKKDAPRGVTEKLIQDSHNLLAKIPSVRGLWVGRPADKDKSTPKVAVTDYQVGLLVLFDDHAGLQTYLDHALHTEYLSRHGKHWERVAVYDFLNQKK